MNNISKCLCGAEPIVETKPDPSDERVKLYKYKCSNCHEKELPWLRQRDYCGALEEWNRIAPKKSYRKRMLEYNVFGVCIDEPYKILEWKDKKGRNSIKIRIYSDNDRYYYCYGYDYDIGGCSSGLWIGETGFPSMELLKAHALKTFGKVKQDIIKIKAKELLQPKPVQIELF